MITIMGIKIPVSTKVLTAPKTAIVLEYAKAVKEGRKEARKILKGLKV